MRQYMMDGDFFVGAALATTLTKLALKYIANTSDMKRQNVSGYNSAVLFKYEMLCKLYSYVCIKFEVIIFWSGLFPCLCYIVYVIFIYCLLFIIIKTDFVFSLW
jgi:hypothetical protein